MSLLRTGLVFVCAAVATAAACRPTRVPPPPAAPSYIPFHTAPAITSRDVDIYVFDGGIYADHPHLSPRVRKGFTAWPDQVEPCNSHGTAVAGAAAGSTTGGAPDAHIVDVRIINCDMQRGTVDAIVRGSDWAIADHLARGTPGVVSWAFSADTSGVRVPALDSAAQRLRDAGMLVVVSAGNFDLDACQISPNNAPTVFVVGATKTTGLDSSWHEPRAPWSAWGICVDVFAPGEALWLPSSHAAMRAWRGTSMAAGLVVGVAAALLHDAPNATPDQLAREIRARTRGGILPLHPFIDTSAVGKP